MLKVLELFGGIGAPRKALENIGVEVKSIDYVEVLTNAVKAYNNMFDNDYKSQDIREWNMNVDLLVHGSPCVDFSTIGKNDMASGRSILYERTLEIIEKELHPRPKYVLWENVPGLLSKRHIHHFEHYLKTMEELGYRNKYRILNSLDYGLPQNRERVFVVSIRSDIEKIFNFDNLETKEKANIKDFLESEVSDRYNLTQPSMIRALEDRKVKIIIDQTSTITTKQVRWNNAGLVVKDLSFYDQDFSKLPKPKSKWGYNIDELKEYIPELFEKPYEETFRYLTPLECWRLQGFSDQDFNNVSSVGIPETDLYMLAGNSIPVPVLEALFTNLFIETPSEYQSTLF